MVADRDGPFEHLARLQGAKRYLVASDSTLGPWQPRPIKVELFTSPTHHSSIEDLVRASKGNLCLSAFSMHRDDDLALAPLFMLVSVKAAAVLGQPFPKCGTFHCFVPMYQDLDCVEPLRLQLHSKLSNYAKILGGFR